MIMIPAGKSFIFIPSAGQHAVPMRPPIEESGCPYGIKEIAKTPEHNTVLICNNAPAFVPNNSDFDIEPYFKWGIVALLAFFAIMLIVTLVLGSKKPEPNDTIRKIIGGYR